MFRCACALATAADIAAINVLIRTTVHVFMFILPITTSRLMAT
jgi:hypothetical protein